MRKCLAIFSLLCCLFLVGCRTGAAYQAKIEPMEASELYTEKEIQDAVVVVQDYFDKHFTDCQLLTIGYGGDDEKLFDDWAENYGAEEAIVLTSSFKVAAEGAEPTLEPNSIHRDWKWILVRNAGGKWEHRGHGY
ncbi:TPA: hypothetical protein U1617_001173 [Streptococcus suis]|nr:hypothetical protein [Streptococcus suis]HEM5490620.1 hypothetical protein [Streptococcus suis]